MDVIENGYIGKCVAYEIRNKLSHKVYVGSTENLSVRKRAHVNSLRARTHENRNLQKDWDEYGEHQFELRVLESADNREEIYDVEQRILDGEIINSDIGVYNVALDVRSNLGIKKTKESRDKMSKSHTGKIPTDKHKKSISKAMKGYTKTSEHQKKITEAIRKRPISGYLSGEDYWNSTLTEVQVREILTRASEGERSIDLAHEYAVTDSAIA